MITLDQMLHHARSRLTRVLLEDLELEAEAGALVVDVRTGEQIERDGDVPGAHIIDLTVLEWRLAPSSRYREIDFPPDQRVILVCSQGYSSSLAAARLQDLGLSNATDLEGGYEAWKALTDRGDFPGVATSSATPSSMRSSNSLPELPPGGGQWL